MLGIKNFKCFGVLNTVNCGVVSKKNFIGSFRYDLNFVRFFGFAQNGFTPMFLGNKVIWVQRLVEEYFPGIFTAVNFSAVNGVIFYVPRKYMLFVAQFFKYSHFFRADELLDIFAVDYPSRVNRFELTYVLLSVKKNERVYLRCNVAEFSALPSLSGIFNTANWLEREI